MYALSTSKDESMNADKTFIKNLIYNREYHNEPLVNIEYPLLIANTGVLLGVTAGRIQKGPAWNNPFELFIYSKILQSMYNQKKKDKVIIDIGYLMKYNYNGIFNLSLPRSISYI